MGSFEVALKGEAVFDEKIGDVFVAPIVNSPRHDVGSIVTNHPIAEEVETCRKWQNQVSITASLVKGPIDPEASRASQAKQG